MRYELMRPGQLRAAIERNLPVILPLGVLEYHGEHLGLGMDTLAVTRVLDRLEEKHDIVILPAFYHGAASHAVAGPEGTGTVHVDAEAIVPLARQVFAGLLRVGFRNIHGIIHHQSENFAAGMPTDLAFRLAAKQAVFAHLERERGEGWWGDKASADYYAAQATGADPFSWVRIHPLMGPRAKAAYPFDHAGIGETSLMLALCPEATDMDLLADEPWYVASAREASADLGEKGVALILEDLCEALSLGRT